MNLIERVQRVPQVLRNSVQAARASLLWALLRRQRAWVKAMLLLFVAVTGLAIIIAQLTAAMIDQGIVEQTAPLWPFVSRIVRLAAVYLFIQFAMSQVTARVTYQIEFDLRVWLYTRIQAAEAARLDRVAGGQMVTRALTDLQLVERILGIVPAILGMVPLLLGLTVFLFILSWPMAILAAAAMPINLWTLSRFRHRLWGLSWADLNERAEVMTAIDEPVRGIRVVKAFGREEHERGQVAAVCLRAYRFAMTRVRLLARYDLVLKFVPYVLNAVVLAIGANLVANGSLTLGVFLIAFQLSQLMMSMALILSELASAWQYLRSAQGRLLDMLGLGSRLGSEGGRLPEPSTGLELRSISIELGGRPVLTDLDLTVAPGELVVVTGAPSSGKTTLAAVAAGLLAVDGGVVLLDGAELPALEQTLVREVVRIVSEESILFAAPLRENLEMGTRSRADDAALEAALWAAGAEELLDVIDGGLDGQVGDRGLTISGGQRQRLALARALVHPPRVLVLDDALAAVNPSLEMEILERIRRHAPDTAVLCISRRAALGAVADRVVALPDPAVVDDQASDREPLVATPAPTDIQDATLAGIVGGLELSDESPGLPESAITDEKPTVGTAGRIFGGLIALALFVLVIQSLGQLGPEALFGAVADVIEDGPREANFRAGALVLVGAVFTVASYAFRILAQRFNQGLIYLLRRRVFLRLSRLGVDFYDRELPGQVAARVVHDLDQINEFLQVRGFRMLTHAGQVVIGLTVIVILSSEVFPVVAVMVAAIAVVTVVQFPIAMRAFGWARDELGRVTAKFEEDLTGRTEIRNLGAHELQLRKFVAASWQRRRARWWSMTVANAYSAIIQFIGTAGAAFVLYRAGNLVIAASLSIGAALSLRLLSTAATQPLSQIGAEYRDFLDVRVSWQRLRQPFDVDILPVEAPNAEPCPSLAGDVAFEQVAFAYPHTGQQVLHDVTFRMNPGTVTALVGYTGAGKSSIAKLLSRTYDPDQGRVLVDGHDLRDLQLRSYRRRLGIVPQDAFLFRGTVASNIAYGRPDADMVDIEAAAWAVGAGELLSTLPGGFDHPVEEEARNLPAARRQLIALARAWLAGPDILVLDEATSCLDAHLEERVMEALAEIGCTTLMITHREQVAARADAVVVLEAGRVVQAGPASEVVASGGAFDRLGFTEEQIAGGFAREASAPAGRRASRPGRRRSGTLTASRGPSRAELYATAKHLQIPGRSRMSADELLAAVEQRNGKTTGNGRRRS